MGFHLHSELKIKSKKNGQREGHWMNGRSVLWARDKGGSAWRRGQEMIDSIRSKKKKKIPCSLHILNVAVGRVPSEEPEEQSPNLPALLNSVPLPREEI